VHGLRAKLTLRPQQNWRHFLHCAWWRYQGSAAMMEGSKKMIAMRLAKHEQAVLANAKPKVPPG